MTIYQIAVDFISLLLGTIAETPRGALVAEYFGYIVVAITIVLLVKIAIWLITYPFKGWLQK